MALSHTPQEELDKIEKLDKYYSPLHARMDADWGRFCLEDQYYKIPTKEGEWDNVKTNRVVTEGNKLVDYLSYAKRKLWIPEGEETKADRESLSATEQLTIGVLSLADMLNEDIPEYVCFQSADSFYIVHRGWTCSFCYLYEEDGKLTPQIASWDVRDTRWISGRKGLIWVSHIRYATKEQVKDEYEGWNGEADDTGFVKIHDVWDKEEEAVIIGNVYVKKPTKHKLGYIPLRIKPGRSTPLIQGTNNIAMMGESFQANYRELVQAESRLLTYNMTRAGQMAKAPYAYEYDSELGGVVEGISIPDIKGKFIGFDVSKKQKYIGQLTPPSGNNIEASLDMLQGMANKGGLTNIAYGSIDQALQTGAIDILSRNTMDALKPFKLQVEKDYVWLAQEIARQYKNGDFGEMEFEGYDRHDKRFKAKINPDEINDNWRFTCELVPDLLKDMTQNLNNAVAAVKSKLLSKQTTRDKFALTEDPDHEQEIIDREDSEDIAGYKLGKMAIALHKDGDHDGEAIVMAERDKLIQQARQQVGMPPEGQPSPDVMMGARPMMPQNQLRRMGINR